MRLVIVESPYAAPTPEGIERNESYARACLADCLAHDEAPFASHLLYTQPRVLDDTKPAERTLGITAGLAWGRLAAASVVYVDLGISNGMLQGIRHAHGHARPVEIRRLQRPALERAIGPSEAARWLERRPLIDAMLAEIGKRASEACDACAGLGHALGALDAAECLVCHGTGRR